MSQDESKHDEDPANISFLDDFRYSKEEASLIANLEEDWTGDVAGEKNSSRDLDASENPAASSEDGHAGVQSFGGLILRGVLVFVSNQQHGFAASDSAGAATAAFRRKFIFSRKAELDDGAPAVEPGQPTVFDRARTVVKFGFFRSWDINIFGGSSRADASLFACRRGTAAAAAAC
eukprot:g15673.t1